VTKDRKEIEKLRLSIQRIAEATGNKTVIKLIPESVAVNRGWNRLCLELVYWINDPTI